MRARRSSPPSATSRAAPRALAGGVRPGEVRENGTVSSPEAAPGHPEITRIVAPNPGPMTLAGTNTYVVGSDPAWVIDPGPADAGHIEAVLAEAESRGGIGSVLLTHGHLDHTAGVEMLGANVIWGRTDGRSEDAELAAAMADNKIAKVRGSHAPPDSDAGPFTVVPTPGHARDHVVFKLGDVCFCGDLVLGEGSSIVPPQAAGGSLADYMRSLERLAELDVELLCPGHGPWITDPAAKIAEYREHRLDRERKLLAAFEDGERSRARLLELAWDDVVAGDATRGGAGDARTPRETGRRRDQGPRPGRLRRSDASRAAGLHCCAAAPIIRPWLGATVAADGVPQPRAARSLPAP